MTRTRFDLAELRPEGATIIVCRRGDYMVNALDRGIAEMLNSSHGLSIFDQRTKGWKWLWAHANEEVNSQTA